MVEKVEAWRDVNGHLHKTQADAVEADFISMIRKVWGHLPSERDSGDPVVIARLLASPVYPAARKALMDALLFFEEYQA